MEEKNCRERKWIISILWISLGIHILYLMLRVLLVAFQKQVQGFYLSKEAYIIPPPYLLLESIVHFTLHLVFTVTLVKRLYGKNNSISAELAGAIIYGGVYPLLSIIVSPIVTQFINSMGINRVVSYSVFNRASAFIDPIQAIAINLFLLATGMSLYWKLAYKVQNSVIERRIVKLLREALALNIVSFLIMAVIVIHQNQIKHFFDFSDIKFIVPIGYIGSRIVLLLVLICLTVIQINQLKSGYEGIVWEILGVLFYSGILGWLGVFLNCLTFVYLARADSVALANFGFVNVIINFFSPIGGIGINVFRICCGMTIIRKKSARTDR